MPRPHRSFRASVARRGVVALAVLALAVSTFGAPVGASNDPVSTLNSVLYAVSKPLCTQPATVGQMRCYSYKRVEVKKGTKGSYAYRPALAAGPAGGYTPATFARAYGFNPKTNRANLTVAIVLWYDAPNVVSDLNRFNAKYGLPRETSTSFRKVNQNGRSSPLPKADPGAAGEIALDTQTVRAVCNTCKILLVEANNPTVGDLAVAVNTAARMGAAVISNSYGTPESSIPASLFNVYNHPGVAITAATGDDGWYGWDFTNGLGGQADGAASFPAISPNVVAVGGTTLTVNAQGARTSETVWNSNGPHDSVGSARGQARGASGGGCSQLYAAKRFQAIYPGYSAAGCGGRRLAADVALDADPATGFDVYDSYGSGGWVTVGGTSLSAPLAAGMYALAGGAAGAAFPADALYTNAATRPGTRYDVTSGGNGYCGGDSPSTCYNAVRQQSLLGLGSGNPNNLNKGRLDCSFASSGENVPASSDPECNAVPGYDGASGVGAPTTASLFSRTDPVPSIARASTIRQKRGSRFIAGVRYLAPRTPVQHYVWTWGDGQTTSTQSTSSYHTYARSGTYNVTLTLIDSRGQYANTTIRLTVTR